MGCGSASLPCRRGTTYVTELYECFSLNVFPGGPITLHDFRRYFCNGTGGNEVGTKNVLFLSLNKLFSLFIWSLITQAVYKMSVAALFTKPNPLTAEEHTNRIFVRLDKDNNTISLEEFIMGALDDEWIGEMLECDLNTESYVRQIRSLKSEIV
uniref:Si:ch211-245j22.3 n=1 Tax=Oncorhynchus mykiss TaxID=8022 RepID=A0A8C7RHC3_ONCMY